MIEDPHYHNSRGKIIWNLGRHKEAFEEFNTAIKLDPNNPDFYADRSHALRYFNKLDEALNDINTAIKLDPNNPKFYMDRRLTFQKLKKEKEASDDMYIATVLAVTGKLPKENEREIFENLDLNRSAVSVDQIEIGNFDNYSRADLIKEFTKSNENLDKIIKETNFDSIILFCYNKIENLRQLSIMSDIIGKAFNDNISIEMRIGRYTPETNLCRLLIERTCQIENKSDQKQFEEIGYKEVIPDALKLYRLSEKIDLKGKINMNPDFVNAATEQRIAILKKAVEQRYRAYKNTNSQESNEENDELSTKENLIYEGLDKNLKQTFGFNVTEYLLVMGAITNLSESHKIETIANVKVKDINDEKELISALHSDMSDPLKSPYILSATLDELIKHTNELTGVDRTVIINVIDFCTLNKKPNSIGGSLEIWKTSSRPNRLSIKPFVLLKNGKLVFGSDTLKSTIQLFRIGFDTGKWIYSRDLLPVELRQSLEKVEEIAANKFEYQVYDKVSSYADICKKNLFSHLDPKEEFLILTGGKFPGEIDVLSIHKSNKLIIVWEVKYLIERFGSRENYWDLEEFEKDYLIKVRKKADFITANMLWVLLFYNLEGVDGWKVRTCFVIPEKSLLQLILNFNNADTTFISFDDIEEFLDQIDP